MTTAQGGLQPAGGTALLALNSDFLQFSGYQLALGPSGRARGTQGLSHKHGIFFPPPTKSLDLSPKEMLSLPG